MCSPKVKLSFRGRHFESIETIKRNLLNRLKSIPQLAYQKCIVDSIRTDIIVLNSLELHWKSLNNYIFFYVLFNNSGYFLQNVLKVENYFKWIRNFSTLKITEKVTRMQQINEKDWNVSGWFIFLYDFGNSLSLRLLWLVNNAKQYDFFFPFWFAPNFADISIIISDCQILWHFHNLRVYDNPSIRDKQ